MPNVAAAAERVSTSPPAGLNLHTTPISDLQLTTKLCSACSRPLNVQDTQQRPMVPVGATRASLCSSCGEDSKAEGDRPIGRNPLGRNEANSSNAPSQPIPLPLASLTPNTALKAVPSGVSNDQGRLQFPQKSSRNTFQDAPSLSISPYSPTPASYFVSRMHSPSAHANPLDLHATSIEPLVDITRLRVRSTGISCLYPGETFLGIQTNRGKEHEVSVTIMDVNLASSTLSGSLTIHDLTLNDPELTTYFDGEIIGSRFGFLTPEQSWGATGESDLAHWERFGAPFRAVKGDLCRPDLTMRGGERGERGVVFMRWKERFLMPDHKVTSVAGASFAGFYYICLELGSSAHHDHETDDSGSSDTSTSHNFTTYTPHLSGYYYFAEKDMCDQYQKLTLHHVPRPARACFEFR